MKKIALYGLAGLALLVGVLAGAAALRPDELMVSRSRALSAPVDKVLPFLTDLELWGRFNPWDRRDPNMKKSFGDRKAGVGASYHWAGNQDVGKGSLTIVGIDPIPSGTEVQYDLAFLEPFESTADVSIRVIAEGQGSRVTWSMRSPENFISKLMGLFMDMEGMIGGDFEAGLANLEQVTR